MNVLSIWNLGGESRDFHGPRYADAFEELGHTVTRIRHDVPLPNGIYDMIFHFYHSITKDKIDELKSRGVVTVLLIGDEPCEFFRTQYFTPFYDLTFNQTGGPDNIAAHNALGADMYSLPHCADPGIYYPVDITEADRGVYGADVSFIGSIRTPGIRGDRLWMSPDMFPGVDFRMWGPGTPNDRWIYPEEVRKIYAASKVIWNPTAVADQPDWDFRFPTILGGPACRIFNTAVAGAFQLAPRREDWYFQPFTDEEDIVYYRHGDTDDLAEKIIKYLDDPDSRSRISAAGRNRVLDEHTYVHRARIVLDKVMEYGNR